MTVNQEIVLTVQLSTDGKGFKRVGNAHTPWVSTSEFLTNTPNTRRHEGMFGYIRGGSGIDIWHFVGGIADEDLVKYSLDSISSLVFKTINDDFPAVGEADKIYINTTTKTPYIWDGSTYQVIGNPGPTGAKGDKGDKGDQGDQGIQGIQGETGPAGADGTAVTLRTNGVNNGVQDVLDLIDSDTIGVEYIGTGQVKLYTLSKVLFNGKAGTSEAIAAGVIVGSTSYTNSKLAGHRSEVFRSGMLISDFDQGGGVEYAIKDTDGTLDSDTITFLNPIYDGEWIKIKIE